MAGFQRLTRDDLDYLTRGELMPRLEAEQEYWARKEKRGLNEDDRRACREFSDILYAAISPAGLAEAMAETTAWLKGERATASSYWSEKPGRPAALQAGLEQAETGEPEIEATG